MGFLSGRMTCIRYKVSGPAPRRFGPEHLEQLDSQALGKQRAAQADGSTVGWGAGDHILDTRFDLEKNIINDALHFTLRVDSQHLPADLLRAYTAVELEALTADNPNGRPSARQKREARQIALERLEAQAADGRFLRRKAYELLWDGQSNELLVGTHSAGIIDYLVTLFRQTFARGLDLLSAGRQAFFQAETRNQGRQIDDARLPAYVPGAASEEVAWLPDENNRDFLGNEFLLWLWYVLANESDSIKLADGSTATVMLTRMLVLECPRGQTGKESISSDGPTQLPEALRAIQAGKLPRKVGLIVVRHDQQYELTLSAETLGISAAKLPAPEGDTDRARLEERIGQIRHLLETLDLLYDAFGSHRFGSGWHKELGQIQKWLSRDDRPRFSATG